ncbi:U3 snoRNA-associated protein 12 [Hanseniaspora valbyensis NRRL Y-1626]|uniref:U3 snoRNA-associated protein 12 n=1 Tax=Hanseniaspora valbyensis NRRL Y-1626 TaxID=766949 RepID=A0A1B7TIG3_9ASCO|nr:U3 snoRNA-associated protein 12 [Hanseniaspora valbyensis NRRL Y-1626]
MARSYKRFVQQSQFGIIATTSSSAPVYPLAFNIILKAAGPQLQKQNIKTDEILQSYAPQQAPPGSLDAANKPQAQVLCFTYNEQTQLIAVGYTDGKIILFDEMTGEEMMSFVGHSAGISMLKFNVEGTMLFSGSLDSKIVSWDVVSEIGLGKYVGHKGAIVGLEYIEESASSTETGLVLSLGKDGVFKVWDLSIGQCVESKYVGFETFAFGLQKDLGVCVVLGGGNEVKLFDVDFINRKEGDYLIEKCTIEKQSKQRGVLCEFILNSNSYYMQILSNDKTVEIFRVRSNEELDKGLKKKQKRLTEAGELSEEEIAKIIQESRYSSIFQSIHSIRSIYKLKSSKWDTTSKQLSLILTTAANSIEYHTINLEDNKKQVSSTEKKLDLQLKGHRTDIRSCDISHDNKILSTASNGELKIWNLANNSCLRTFTTGYALCSKILPGNTLVIVGTREGHLQLFDLVTSNMILEIENAHDGAVWCLDVSNDGRTIITGSQDKSLKFWKVEATNDELELVHDTTVELGEDVLALRLSPSDNKFLAVSLLDNTVKIFFFDTMKFFLSLYGHKLPVLDLDISFDNKIIITCSADKNVKIWGLDFGDCHRSIFAHNDSIMQIKFIPTTHRFFTASKDKEIKYWDGDKFEMIQKLVAHNGEVWCLAINDYGDKLVSCSHDHSIRVWEEIEDEVFVEEEREKELEEQYEENLLEQLEKPKDEMNGEGEDAENADGVTAVTQQTMESLKAGERLMAALDLGVKEIEQWDNYHEQMAKWEQNKATSGPQPMKPSQNAILMAIQKTPEEYILETLLKIRSSQLEDALLAMSFSYTLRFLKFINRLLSNDIKLIQHLQILIRVLTFIIRNNYRELTSQRDPTLKLELQQVQSKLRQAIKGNINDLGFNLKGLRIVSNEWNNVHSLSYMDDDEYDTANKERLRARKRVFETTI